jgi:hypothetical protein
VNPDNGVGRGTVDRESNIVLGINVDPKKGRVIASFRVEGSDVINLPPCD